MIYLILGIRGFTEVYVSNFRKREINGKALSFIDLDDLNELIPDNLNQKIITLKSIQNLINIVSKKKSYKKILFIFF